MNAYIWWFIAGAVMLAIEVFAVPTFVMCFAGLAAICVGITIGFGLIDPTGLVLQWAFFFGFTVVWAALLWKPLKKMRTPQHHDSAYKNILGEFGTVTKGALTKGEKGHVKWSGTVMNAALSDSTHVDSLPEGTAVEITDVKGNTLTVKPK